MARRPRAHRRTRRLLAGAAAIVIAAFAPGGSLLLFPALDPVLVPVALSVMALVSSLALLPVEPIQGMVDAMLPSRKNRLNHVLCPRCSHDMQGNVNRRCPECG
jgi:hypothetical protein